MFHPSPFFNSNYLEGSGRVLNSGRECPDIYTCPGIYTYIYTHTDWALFLQWTVNFSLLIIASIWHNAHFTTAYGALPDSTTFENDSTINLPQVDLYAIICSLTFDRRVTSVYCAHKQKRRFMHPVCEHLLMMSKHVRPHAHWAVSVTSSGWLDSHGWGWQHTQAAYAVEVTANIFQVAGMLEQTGETKTFYKTDCWINVGWIESSKKEKLKHWWNTITSAREIFNTDISCWRACQQFLFSAAFLQLFLQHVQEILLHTVHVHVETLSWKTPLKQ